MLIFAFFDESVILVIGLIFSFALVDVLAAALEAVAVAVAVAVGAVTILDAAMAGLTADAFDCMTLVVLTGFEAGSFRLSAF